MSFINANGLKRMKGGRVILHMYVFTDSPISDSKTLPQNFFFRSRVLISSRDYKANTTFSVL